jgi:predicted O-methyltransferase YrrM
MRTLAVPPFLNTSKPVAAKTVAAKNEKYNFTTDWFSSHIPNWKGWFKLLKRKQTFLEIGCYEGRATTWLLDNQLDKDGYIYCVDTWKGSAEHKGINMDFVRQRFEDNLRFHTERTIVWRKPSLEALNRILRPHGQKFIHGTSLDFIYIDGSHHAKDVLQDAVLSWPLLAEGGLLIFDDYGWGRKLGKNSIARPKPAIDAFLRIYREEMVILHVGYQVAILKTPPITN